MDSDESEENENVIIGDSDDDSDLNGANVSTDTHVEEDMIHYNRKSEMFTAVGGDQENACDVIETTNISLFAARNLLKGL